MSPLLHRPVLARIARLLLAGLLLAVAAWAGANGLGYWQYRQAWRRAERLGQEELARIAAACAEPEKGGGRRMSTHELPPALRSLRPVSVSFSPGTTHLKLYSLRDDAGVWLSANTSKDNQRIWLWSSVVSPQRHVVLWDKDPALAQRLEPLGRIVTVTQYAMRDRLEWIVLPAEIRVVDWKYPAGGGATLLARVPLSAEARREIETAVTALPASVRGRQFVSGTADGIGLAIRFRPNGEHDDGDLEVDNTWREEAAPLLNAISAPLPAEHAITFQAKIVGREHSALKYQTSRPWAELHAAERTYRWDHLTPLPWWCAWPRLLR